MFAKDTANIAACTACNHSLPACQSNYSLSHPQPPLPRPHHPPLPPLPQRHPSCRPCRCWPVWLSRAAQACLTRPWKRAPTPHPPTRPLTPGQTQPPVHPPHRVMPVAVALGRWPLCLLPQPAHQQLVAVQVAGRLQAVQRHLVMPVRVRAARQPPHPPVTAPPAAACRPPHPPHLLALTLAAAHLLGLQVGRRPRPPSCPAAAQLPAASRGGTWPAAAAPSTVAAAAAAAVAPWLRFQPQGRGSASGRVSATGCAARWTWRAPWRRRRGACAPVAAAGQVHGDDGAGELLRHWSNHVCTQQHMHLLRTLLLHVMPLPIGGATKAEQKEPATEQLTAQADNSVQAACSTYSTPRKPHAPHHQPAQPPGPSATPYTNHHPPRTTPYGSPSPCATTSSRLGPSMPEM